MSENAVRLLKIRDVCERVGLSRCTIYRLIREGNFPPPCHPAPGAARWPSDEIAAFVNGLRAQREAAPEAS